MRITHSLSRAKPGLVKKFTKNPNASISTAFRNLKKNPKYSIFGDYPIISLIVETMREQNIEISRQKVRYALKQSEELKGKSKLIDALLNQ